MVINIIRIAFTQSSSYSELLSKWLSSRSCLKFRGGNDDRNWIYSSPPEVISDAILFVYPLGGALAEKCTRVSHKMVLKIARLAISMESTPLLEKVSSCGLLTRLWLLVRSEFRATTSKTNKGAPRPVLLCWKRSRDNKENNFIQGVPVKHLSKGGRIGNLLFQSLQFDQPEWANKRHCEMNKDK